MKKLHSILLVDDDEPTNYLHKRIIRRADVADETFTVENGEDAIEFLLGRGRYKGKNLLPPEPILVFVDINMPRMDGWEFLEAYKNLPEAIRANRKIMMLTTSPHPEDKKKAEGQPLVAGFYNKPMTKEMLKEIIEDHFDENTAA